MTKPDDGGPVSRLSRGDVRVLKRIHNHWGAGDFSHVVSLKKRGLLTIDAGNPPDSGNISIKLTEKAIALLSARKEKDND